MPGFVKTPKDEARWAKAKEAAGKSTSHGSESFWKLSNYIYHKMGKTEKDQQLAEMYKTAIMVYNTELLKSFGEINKLSIENLKDLGTQDRPAQQSIVGNEVEHMSDEKKYSAKDAAIAVLKKAEEVLKKSEALKKSKMDKSEEPKGEIHPKEPQAGESEQPGERVEETAPPAPTQINPKVNSNPEWGTTPGAVKGHFKLAKFCGHVSAKRKAKVPPAGAM